MYTLEELAQLLVDRVDPDELVELLNLDTECLVNRNMDIIEVKRDIILEYFGEEEDEEDEDGYI